MCAAVMSQEYLHNDLYDYQHEIKKLTKEANRGMLAEVFCSEGKRFEDHWSVSSKIVE